MQKHILSLVQNQIVFIDRAFVGYRLWQYQLIKDRIFLG